MNVSLKLDTSNNGKEKPLYIRLRGKSVNGKTEETSISTEIKLLPRHFKNNGISKSSPNYSSKMKVVNSILDEIENIIGEINHQGEIPNPTLVKHLYSENRVSKEVITPNYRSFWNSFEEFYLSKEHNLRGYVKTLLTLKNHLLGFQKHSKRARLQRFRTQRV